nr:DUF1673 family protein [Methanosarcina horonobensis]
MSSSEYFFAIILLMVSVLVFLPYVVRTIFHNMQTLYSFGAGAIFFMWTSYLQIIYWERKNNMRICTKSEGEFRKTYSREICLRERGDWNEWDRRIHQKADGMVPECKNVRNRTPN